MDETTNVDDWSNPDETSNAELFGLSDLQKLGLIALAVFLWGFFQKG